MTLMKMGVIGTSRKEDERRVPIHPEHLNRLPEYIRRQLVFEKGYGIPFNVEDKEIDPTLKEDMKRINKDIDHLNGPKLRIN